MLHITLIHYITSLYNLRYIFSSEDAVRITIVHISERRYIGINFSALFTEKVINLRLYRTIVF
jgi:hypothetical protein